MPIFTTRVNFNNTNGRTNGGHRVGDLPADAAGDLSGTTALGGADGDGTVFDIPSMDGSSVSTPATLDGANGAYPDAGLIAAAGDLSGTATGTFANMDTDAAAASTAADSATSVAATAAPTLTTLVTFNGPNGQGPNGSLVADAAGDLFGTTPLGGAYTLGSLDDAGYGTAFEIAKTGGGYASTPTTLFSFNGTDGDLPNGGLIADAAGDLFGTTGEGGANPQNAGTVLEIAYTGGRYAATPTTLVSFNGFNGGQPNGGLIADAAGDLFGTTYSGGAPGAYGNVFEIAKTGGGYASTPTVLASFNGINGADLDSSLIADAAGDLFGVAVNGGGTNNDGTVFEVKKDPTTSTGYASTPTALVSFNGIDGATPLGSLIADAAGDLFGTTEAGGVGSPMSLGYGTVFEIPYIGGSYASTPTTLVSFNGTNGVFPESGLIADAAGDLFGTTSEGGAYGYGTVFEIAKTGGGYASTPTTLVSFNVTNGRNPAAGLIADAAGDLFGTTVEGGANVDGTVFELSGTGFQVLSGGGNSVNYTPQGAAVVIDAGLSDAGPAMLAGATVTISAGFLAGDTLNFTNQNGIAGSYNASTGVLTLTGSASLANYQAALESITFTSTSGNPSDSGTDPSRTVSWTVTDGTLSSNMIASTIDIIPVPPVLPGGGNSVNYTPQGAAVAVDAGLGVSDISSATLAGATVAISAGFFAGDMLNFTNQNGIAGSYNASTGVLTLTGSASLADYQAALESVTFSSTSGNPSNSGADLSRTVNWTVTDGTLSSNTIASTIAVGPSTPVGTTADMILRNGTNGDYEIYDIGNNAILAAYPLGQVGLEWRVAGLGGFYGTDTSDMILRATSGPDAGVFEVYDISNNNITDAASMGQVGLEWQVSGFGDFSSRSGETDMLMRNSNTGAIELYDISNNAITSAASLGQVGLEWTVSGFGDFSGNANETDMLMRNSNTGAFEVYDISHNAITSAASMGQVGLEWTVAGFGDFSGNANETDMLMRNSSTGAFGYYDTSHNGITAAGSMGQVGLEWTVAGFGDFSGNANETDMLMRNTNTGAFEFYDISNNAITSAGPMGQVGLEWTVAGIAADPPADPPAASTAALVQAMAGFSSGGAALDQGAINQASQEGTSQAGLFAAPALQHAV